MPELPDVEGFRRALAERLPGRRVRGVRVHDAGVLRNTSTAQLRRSITGQRFAKPWRHGKWLVLPTNGPLLLVHSGMTGRPYYATSSVQRDRHERLVLSLDRGELRYTDQRKLRGIWLARDEAAAADMMGAQGPDALTVDRAAFASLLESRRGRLKPTLTDQSVVAGLGNLLADEICWRACLHPERRSGSLTADEVAGLHRAMRAVLRSSVRHGRVPALRGWLTAVRDRDHALCPRCGTTLKRTRIGGRATVWCPNCQPAGRG